MRIRPVDLMEVFAYLVVLGLFIQFVPSIISETFVLALLTAVLLKVTLEAVLWVKGVVVRRIRGARGRVERTVAVVMLLLVMPGSKFLVLKLTDLAFGDAVQLGGFFSVTGLIVALMASRTLLRRVTGAGQLEPQVA